MRTRGGAEAMSMLSAPMEPTCRSCRAPIIWGKTWAPRDEWVPLDAEPDEHGQWVLLRTGPKVMPRGAVIPAGSPGPAPLRPPHHLRPRPQHPHLRWGQA